MYCRKYSIRLRLPRGLIFFSLLLLLACEKKKHEIKLLWDNQQATGISIPKSLLTGNNDSIERRILIRLVKEGKPLAIFGNYKVDNDEVIFDPLIPFTRGIRYEIAADGRIVKEITIPFADSEQAPVLLAIYPTQDTVPENLLKIYLHFSKPMREGKSLEYLALLKNDQDTLRKVFLDLQPELWNNDGTMLTVWLDPGRIKRGLQPNKQLGAPLQEGEHYTLVVSDHWKDIQGSSLKKPYFKKFVTTKRDSLSPDPETWIVQSPAPGSLDELDIDLKSSLDYGLLTSALHVVDENEKTVLGKWRVDKEERNVRFLPDKPWREGRYQLQIETRLEDLAGNNINRPFDVDVRSQVKKVRDGKILSLSFNVK